MYASDAEQLHRALSNLVEFVESAIDTGLLKSVDGKRPRVECLREARTLLAELEERGYRVGSS